MKRPRVAVLADVRTWAWARKSAQLEKHLADEFDLHTSFLYDTRSPDPLPVGADLYHTYEVFQASRLPPGLPYVTGITAHVWGTWDRQYGPGTVARWSASARSFHANSLLLVREMQALLGRVIAYCPNGVDESFFRRTRQRSSSSARMVVGFVGKPNPRKGNALVVEACRMAGVELRTIDRRHTNALTAEEMREFYQDLHVLCVASDMDGTPNPALEAAACGVAVVSNHIGNMPEFINEANGILVGPPSLPPRQPDVTALAAALRGLAGDLPRVLRMGEAARAEIERAWTWRALSRNYAEMWRCALAV